MQDRSQNKRSILSGPVLPVPISPYWVAVDLWDVTTAQAKTWSIHFPPDGMIHKLCNYTHIGIDVGYTVSSLYKNDDPIYYEVAAFGITWSPGAAKAPSFKWPDIMYVTLIHVHASFHMIHYWQADFWREQQH